MFSGSSARATGATFALSAMVLTAGIAVADAPPSFDEPVQKGDTLVYPEGAAIPPFETAIEKRFADRFNLRGARGSTPPPVGDVRCVAEYEPMDAIMIAYEGSGSWKDILDQMAAAITTIGDADVYVMCDTTSEANEVNTYMGNAGANLSRVHTQVVGTDSIWIRDYGPRYIYQGECRAIVDHTYNRPTRPNDNQIPSYFSGVKGHAYYLLPLVHGGGNYHLNGVGQSNTTRLINNENPGLSEQEIHDIWMDYQNVDTTFWTPFPTFVDATQHIDMWMQIIGDQQIIISDWPFNVGSTQDVICDGAATHFTNLGWTVIRVPARSVSGTHYTYTNMVLCNDLVLLPSYTNGSVTQHNAEALNIIQNALPGKTIVQINCQAIVTAAGVMHCIVMHVPEHLGGVNPTAYVISPNGGETFLPGENVEINWITDDDQSVSNVDILLSTDGGASFDTVIASATADDGVYIWNVPDVYAPDARIRVVARDGDSNTGFDDSDAGFLIDGTPSLPGDIVAPFGVVDVFDLLELLSNWGTSGPGADIAAPTNVVDVFDLLELLANWS